MLWLKINNLIFSRIHSNIIYVKLNPFFKFDKRSFRHVNSTTRRLLECGRYLVQKRTKSFFRHKYSDEVEKVVNRQIQAEQQAAQNYLSMAVVFLHPETSRPGAGGFFMHMYEEELGHMQDFVHYQLMRGGCAAIQSLNQPQPIQNLTLLEAFKKALDMEKHVTELLENLVSVAEKVKDYQCADFVTSLFLAEQMKSINEMSHHVTKLSRLCDEHAVYHYDLELAKSHPFTYKSKMIK